MTFPTTGILSNFTGEDESPLTESGDYAGPIQVGTGQARRVGNAVGNPAAGNAEGVSYRTGISAADLECGFTVTVLPVAGDSVSCALRVQNPGNPTTAAQYIASYRTGTGFRIWKMTAGGTWAQLGSTNGAAMLAGEKLGGEVIGTAIRCLHYTGGAWVERVSVTDSSITGAGTIGIHCNGALANAVHRIDDHFGGEVVVAPAVTARSLSLLGVGS